MKQDELAPLFNFQSGDRLNSEKLELVNQYALRIRSSKKFWEKDQLPDWLDDYLLKCKRTVPYYNSRPKSLYDQPTIDRSIVRSTPWQFVSSELNLEDLLVYQTSGTTGAAMDVLFDPVSQACWLPQLQSILDLYGINLDSRPDNVTIALVCSQKSTLTYASLSTYLKSSGVLKININPSDWKVPAHRIQYLEKYNPQILTGDPFAFMDLLALKPRITPKALVSSAMKLTEGIRKKLEEYFACPIIDTYSLTECRMIAFAENNRHRAIRPELYLEVFDKDKDILLPYGERGELVITGGNNPFLPLIRYRTGDFCQLEIENGIPFIVDLEARTPVAFYKKNHYCPTKL
ncbi:AMP-binding protein [Williamwhitmania taraxaci]|nr:AMP-binding protein [Williamwhitmania taraxaci]